MQQDVILHECTGAFLKWILERYLPQYDWHFLIKHPRDSRGADPLSMIGDAESRSWLLSPQQVGWPMNRPRLFTLGLRKGRCTLDTTGCQGTSGYERIKFLFQKPGLDCSCFFVAPTESRLNKFCVAQQSQQTVLHHSICISN